MLQLNFRRGIKHYSRLLRFPAFQIFQERLYAFSIDVIKEIAVHVGEAADQ